jgi:hypothetical protein
MLSTPHNMQSFNRIGIVADVFDAMRHRRIFTARKRQRQSLDAEASPHTEATNRFNLLF